jgi:hypothetical protein
VRACGLSASPAGRTGPSDWKAWPATPAPRNVVASSCWRRGSRDFATNAAKHGSLSAAGGDVEVAWSRTAGGRLSLRWTESGGSDLEVSKVARLVGPVEVPIHPSRCAREQLRREATSQDRGPPDTASPWANPWEERSARWRRTTSDGVVEGLPRGSVAAGLRFLGAQVTQSSLTCGSSAAAVNGFMRRRWSRSDGGSARSPYARVRLASSLCAVAE